MKFMAYHSCCTVARSRSLYAPVPFFGCLQTCFAFFFISLSLSHPISPILYVLLFLTRLISKWCWCKIAFRQFKIGDREGERCIAFSDIRNEIYNNFYFIIFIDQMNKLCSSNRHTYRHTSTKHGEFNVYAFILSD